mgnify:FL=1
MVRLRVTSQFDVSSVCKEFQFQYGTIESIRGRLCLVLMTNFNSSMVRLREGVLNNIFYPSQDFNSSMVRLRVGLSATSINTLSDFNSSMVRLREQRA